MQGMSDQFFTGAGFAVNQHANRRTRKPTDNTEHVLHGWRFADDIGRWAVKLNITRLLLFLVMTMARSTSATASSISNGLGR